MTLKRIDHASRRKIKAIGKIKSSKSLEIIDCKNLIITHGFCDVHVHFREHFRNLNLKSDKSRISLIG